MARPALTAEQRTAVERRQQRQLLRGMAEVIADKGYGATTIADVVRAAHVSKSTFYAHFTDKEECYVALFSAASDNVLAAMVEAHHDAGAQDLPWRDHLRAVNEAYLDMLAAGGGLTQSLLVEVQTAGPAALRMRRDIFGRYVRLMRGVADELRRADPRLRPVRPETALAIVGGINELVAEAIGDGPVADIVGLADVATDLWAAVLTSAAG
ncbi:MAG TPA: helix-turn-helix domain-containing protein [Baekduia sp.]|nr:helix-turn-helix domain-containing protein [Baekduia sp.]